MQTSDKSRFAEAMGELKAAYTSYRTDDAEWRRTMAAYWRQLERLEWDDVLASTYAAPQPDYYPDRFPTAGQLLRVATTRKVERAERARQQAAARREAEEHDAVRERRVSLPSTQEGMEKYISEGATPFERLGRMWECESKAKGINPGATTPPDLHASRMRQFWATWAKVHDRKTA